MSIVTECPICKTRKLRKTSDGGLTCRYGHKILDFQVEEQDTEMIGTGNRRKRVKILRDDHIGRMSKAQQQSELLLIIQFTIQTITQCMVQELGFPSELENIVRELWLLYIADSKREIEEAYIFEANQKKEEDKTMKVDTVQKMEDIEDMEIKLLEFSDSSSSDESESEQKPTVRVKQPGVYRLKWPKIGYVDALVFVYLGCLYLNYPVIPNDFRRWAETGQIPYLDMQKRIPKELLSRLSLLMTNTMGLVPGVSRINSYAYTLSRCYAANCKVEFPPCNIPLYLDRFCSQYFLPVEGYYYASYLLQLYRTRFYVRPTMFRSSKHKQLPSILLACVVVASKIIYELGDHRSDCNKASRFNVSTTKDTWIKQISANLERWRSIAKSKSETNNIIRYLQNTSIAQTAAASAGDNLGAVINILNQRLVNPQQGQTAQPDIFMDSGDLVERESDTPCTNVIQEGQVYYIRKGGFLPQDYSDALALSVLISGVRTSNHIEQVIKLLDRFLVKDLGATFIRMKEFDKLYDISKNKRQDSFA